MGWAFPSANFAFWLNFIFLCHSTITTFHFSSGGEKNQKRSINTFVKGTRFTSNIVCRQESPSRGPDLSLSPKPSHLHELLQRALPAWPAHRRPRWREGRAAVAAGGQGGAGPGGHSLGRQAGRQEARQGAPGSPVWRPGRLKAVASWRLLCSGL